MTKSILAILMFPSLLIACLYDSVETRSPDMPNVPSVNQYFPDSVGNYWEYSVLENGVRRYIESVEIVGRQKLLNGVDASVWVYSFLDVKDTTYTWTTGDTIKITHKYLAQTIQFLNYPEEIYPTPFKDGQQWTGIYLGTYAAKFTSKNEYRISHNDGGPHFESNDTLFFKPNVGFTVKKLSHRVNGPTVTRLFELKKYYLK